MRIGSKLQYTHNSTKKKQSTIFPTFFYLTLAFIFLQPNFMRQTIWSIMCQDRKVKTNKKKQLSIYNLSLAHHK